MKYASLPHTSARTDRIAPRAAPPRNQAIIASRKATATACVRRASSSRAARGRAPCPAKGRAGKGCGVDLPRAEVAGQRVEDRRMVVGEDTRDRHGLHAQVINVARPRSRNFCQWVSSVSTTSCTRMPSRSSREPAARGRTRARGARARRSIARSDRRRARLREVEPRRRLGARSPHAPGARAEARATV
jgi:hypothetical protein